MEYEPVDPPEHMQKIFAAGNDAEELVLAMLADKGRKVFNEQLEVALPITSEIAVVGHIDGQEDDAGLEIKSMGDSVYKSVPHNHNIWNEPGLIQDYKWQISAYSIALKLPFNVLFWNRESHDWFEVTVEQPFYTEAEIRGRILQIESWARQGVLPETCDNKGYPCPVYYVTNCQGTVEWGNEEVAALGLTYKRQKALKDAAEQREKSLRNQLLDAARGDDDSEFVEKKVQTDHVTVSFYKGKSKGGTDWDKLVEDTGVNIEDYKTPGSEYQAIRVTIKKDKDE